MHSGMVTKLATEFRTSPPCRHSSLPLVAVLTLYTASFVVSQPRVVFDSASLYAALVDTAVTHVQLVKSITISSDKGPGSWPLLLNRDCLVDGAPGVLDPRIDLRFATNDRVRLGPGVTLTFRGLVIANAVSRNQLSLDFFAPSAASSAIVLEGVVDLRRICQPLQDIKDTWRRAPRPADEGGPQRPQQQEIVDGPSCNGALGCYNTSLLRSVDAVVDSPAGYRLRLNNTLTVCQQFIPQACIQSLGSDLCYLNSLEDLLSKELGADPTQSLPSSASRDGALSPEARAGVIAGCVVGGVSLLVLLAAVLCCCNRSRAAEQNVAGGGGRSGGSPIFSVLDPTPPAGLSAFHSSGSGDTSASNAVHQHQLHQHQLHQLHPSHVIQGKPVFGAKPPGMRVEGRPSQESTDVHHTPGPVLAAALDSAGSTPSAGGLRPSGSGVDGINSPSLLRQSEQSQAQPQLPTSLAGAPTQSLQPFCSLHAAGGGAGGSSHHSLGSAVWAKLRSMLVRSGSHTTHSHVEPLTLTAAGAPLGAASDLVSSSALGSGTVGAAATGGGTAPRSGVTLSGSAGIAPAPYRPAILRSGTAGTLPSARGSSGGQLLVSGSSRPSIGEIQQELERMEEQLRQEAKSSGDRARGSGSASTRDKPQRSGGGGGGGGAAKRYSSERQPPTARHDRENQEQGGTKPK